MKRFMKRAQPWAMTIAGTMAAVVMLGLLGLVVYQSIVPPSPPTPPLRYVVSETDTSIAETFASDRSIYAPGETLIYTPTLIRQKHGRVDVSRAFYDVTRDQSALLCDGSPAPQIEFWRPLPRGVSHNVRGGRQVLIAIPKMPPGDYLVQSSVIDPANGGEAYVEVPFSIREPC